MNLRSELELLSPVKLIETLSIRIYEPPLQAIRDYLLETATVLRVAILVLDFDTEVEMNGILGFLENSSGLFLAETIEAFEKIGAFETAAVLHSIERSLKQHGVTPARLRANFVGSEAYQISAFRELHGDLGLMVDEIQQHAARLYVYRKSGMCEPVWSLLATFVEMNRAELLAEVARVAGK